ncbi:DinB family protein [Halalkalibacter lacteus]|uniref:DinB family protein n=1 Tax=Halalkalibacter lacteus TaxID=3090663 RepID=UPI002FC5D503
MTIIAFSFARFAITSSLQAVTVNQLDTIPEGFNNSIRWNAGHVLVIAESILSHLEHYEKTLPPHYKEFFHKGTSPADWKSEPPAISEIVELSDRQLQAAQTLVENHTDIPLEKPFELRDHLFSTVPDLLSFLSFHEGLHFTAIKILLKTTTK